MKLKDKKTDKPLTFKLIQTDCECLTEHEVDTLYGEPITLETLNKYCEDYEEPKEFWFIDDEGDVEVECKEYEEHLDKMKSIGNYFKTKEEAEKAVEKLKAWKRLKDKGLRFAGWVTNEGVRAIDFEVPDTFFSEHNHTRISNETMADLDMLFGGEE